MEGLEEAGPPVILNPAYTIVAGTSTWDALPDTRLWWAPRRAVARRMATPEELAGLGSFFKKVAQTVSKVVTAPIKLISPKLASNLQKIDNKIINNVDSVATKVNEAAKSVGKFVAKNWKWVAVVAAIAITIYSMGTGATIAAKMLSGTKLLGAKIAAGWSSVTGGGAAASTAATTSATAASAAGTSGWLASTGKLALSAASALYGGAKVSSLSQQQAQAMLEAQSAGYDLGANDPQLQAALQQRAAIAGAGIPTDAQGNPLVNEPAGWTGTAQTPGAPAVSVPGITPTPALLPIAPGNTGIVPVQAPQVRPAVQSAAQPSALDPLVALTKSPYFMPTAIGAGALLLVLLLRR